MKKTIVVTDCGHQFNTGYTAEIMRGCTMDCKICNRLLIFDWDDIGLLHKVIRARDFHRYLNELDPKWPIDGADTYVVSF